MEGKTTLDALKSLRARLPYLSSNPGHVAAADVQDLVRRMDILENLVRRRMRVEKLMWTAHGASAAAPSQTSLLPPKRDASIEPLLALPRALAAAAEAPGNAMAAVGMPWTAAVSPIADSAEVCPRTAIRQKTVATPPWVQHSLDSHDNVAINTLRTSTDVAHGTLLHNLLSGA